VLDIFAIALAICAGAMRALHLVGFPQTIVDSHEQQVFSDLYGAGADLLVFYGLALASRSHLEKKTLHEAGKPEHPLNRVSEHTGITLVIWGGLLSLVTQSDQLMTDLNWNPVILVFRLAGLATVVVAVHQLCIHLQLSLAAIFRDAARKSRRPVPSS